MAEEKKSPVEEKPKGFLYESLARGNKDWKNYFDAQHEAYLIATGITPAESIELQKFKNNGQSNRRTKKRETNKKVS